MDNMDAEIAMMFIRNCPDHNLACVFKCKPISKRSLTEVQEAIDEHQREHQVKKPAARKHVLQVATAVASADPPETETDHLQVNTTKYIPSNPAKPVDAHASDPNALERVLSMLERVLERTSQSYPTTRPQPTPATHFTPCKVCGDNNHSTRTHCMRERRCLGCLEQGHQRKDCPKATTTQRDRHSPVQGN